MLHKPGQDVESAVIPISIDSRPIPVRTDQQIILNIKTSWGLKWVYRRDPFSAWARSTN